MAREGGEEGEFKTGASARNPEVLSICLLSDRVGRAIAIHREVSSMGFKGILRCRCEEMKMKLFKLFPLVALLFSLSVTAAFAETGKASSSETVGMCEMLAASQKKQEAKEKETPAPSNVVKEEALTDVKNAM
jgi:hypothetical protein